MRPRPAPGWAPGTWPGSPLAGLTVLHLGKDFEIIASITGQPLERLNID
jgi:hypothetical protein